jgi:hypothetical protein
MGFILDMSEAAGPYHVEARSESFYISGEHNWGGNGYEPREHQFTVDRTADGQLEISFPAEDLHQVLAALDDLCLYLDSAQEIW